MRDSDWTVPVVVAVVALLIYGLFALGVAVSERNADKTQECVLTLAEEGYTAAEIRAACSTKGF